jgi:hypothetical protein
VNVTVVEVHIIHEQWEGWGPVNPDYESRFFERFDEGSEAQSERMSGEVRFLGGHGAIV